MEEVEDWKVRLMREAADDESDDSAQSGDAASVTDGEAGAPTKEVPSSDGQADSSNGDLLGTLVEAATKTTASDAQDLPKDAGVSMEEYERIKTELQRLKSEDGRARKLSDELKAVHDENAALREKLERYGEVQPIEGDLSEFDEDEANSMTDEVAMALRRRFAAVKKQNEEFRQQLEEIKNSVTVTRETARSVAMENGKKLIAQRLAQDFPNFQQYLQGDAWQRYCKEVDPVTGKKNGQLFKDAVESVNASAASALMQRFVFNADLASTRETGGVKPTETKVTSSDANVVNGVDINEALAFMNEVQSGRINLNNPQNVKRYKLYSAALDAHL